MNHLKKETGDAARIHGDNIKKDLTEGAKGSSTLILKGFRNGLVAGLAGSVADFGLFKLIEEQTHNVATAFAVATPLELAVAAVAAAPIVWNISRAAFHIGAKTLSASARVAETPIVIGAGAVRGVRKHATEIVTTTVGKKPEDLAAGVNDHPATQSLKEAGDSGKKAAMSFGNVLRRRLLAAAGGVSGIMLTDTAVLETASALKWDLGQTAGAEVVSTAIAIFLAHKIGKAVSHRHHTEMRQHMRSASDSANAVIEHSKSAAQKAREKIIGVRSDQLTEDNSLNSTQKGKHRRLPRGLQ